MSICGVAIALAVTAWPLGVEAQIVDTPHSLLLPPACDISWSEAKGARASLLEPASAIEVQEVVYDDTLERGAWVIDIQCSREVEYAFALGARADMPSIGEPPIARGGASELVLFQLHGEAPRNEPRETAAAAQVSYRFVVRWVAPRRVSPPENDLEDVATVTISF